MKVLIIIIKEFKQNIRDWKATCMMILFPIILMVILGAAFSGRFESSVSLDNVRVLYMAQSGENLRDGFRSFAGELGRELGISFVETADLEKGMESIKNTEYACFIYLGDNPEGIKLYKNDRYNFEGNMVEALVKTFAERYGAIAGIYRHNPAIAGQLAADTSMDFVNIKSLDRKRQPGSLDYYAVAMLTLILMYASLTGLWAVKSEQNMKTGSRILSGPVRKYEYLTGKVLGSILVTIIQALVVILFSKLVLKAWWGNDILTILFIVLTLSIMAISLGTGVAYLIRNEGAASAILNSIIPVVVFFGGGYMPLESIGAGIARLSVISPLKWTNDAIFRIIYSNDYSQVLTAVAINLATAAVFIAVSAVLSGKEAAA